MDDKEIIKAGIEENKKLAEKHRRGGREAAIVAKACNDFADQYDGVAKALEKRLSQIEAEESYQASIATFAPCAAEKTETRAKREAAQEFAKENGYEKEYIDQPPYYKTS